MRKTDLPYLQSYSNPNTQMPLLYWCTAVTRVDISYSIHAVHTTTAVVHVQVYRVHVYVYRVYVYTCVYRVLNLVSGHRLLVSFLFLSTIHSIYAMVCTQ